MSDESMIQAQFRRKNQEIEDLRAKLSQERQDKQEAISQLNHFGGQFDRLATGLGLQMTAPDLVDYLLDNRDRLN